MKIVKYVIVIQVKYNPKIKTILAMPYMIIDIDFKTHGYLINVYQ